MKVVCPKCAQNLPATSINVAADVAHCARCGEIFPLSKLVENADIAPVDLHRPPAGARFETTYDGFVVRATLRSSVAFFMVPFMCIWSGGSLGGIYGSQFLKGEFNLGLSLFGIPFILGTLLFGSLAILSVVGRIVVRVSHHHGSVFTGVGPFGFTRRFDWDSVRAVRVERTEESRQKRGNRITHAILIEGASSLRFGSMLSLPRRDFVAGALREMLRQRRR